MKYRVLLSIPARAQAYVTVDAESPLEALAEGFDKAACVQLFDARLVSLAATSADVTSAKALPATEDPAHIVIVRPVRGTGRIEVLRAEDEREAIYFVTGSWGYSAGTALTFERAHDMYERLRGQVDNGTLISAAVLTPEGTEVECCGPSLPFASLGSIRPSAPLAAVEAVATPAGGQFRIRGYATPRAVSANECSESKPYSDMTQACAAARALLEQEALCTTVVFNGLNHEVARYTRERGGCSVIAYASREAAMRDEGEVVETWLDDVASAKRRMASCLGTKGVAVLKVMDDRGWPARSVEVQSVALG